MDRLTTTRLPDNEIHQEDISCSEREWFTAIWTEVLRGAANFVLGGVSGAFGASTIYPIDLVKTRMQNQRDTAQHLYKDSWDCARQVTRNEGILGLYRGCGVQALGVAPSRAIKISTNDFIRHHAMDPKTGQISLGWELLAGGVAGAAHVTTANPQEIIKIRLQVQGELAILEGVAPLTSIQIARQLGFSGLYQGAISCLLRDVPFAALYFPVFAHMKKDYFLEGYNGKQLSFWETLASASVAGVPACFLVTPADFLKTRLQVQARKGQTTYRGLRHAFRTILREEGPTAFFKGSVTRIVRSSPQYGVALAAYEHLQKLLFVQHGK